MYAEKPLGLVLAVVLLVSTGTASGQTEMGTAFTYQGFLEDQIEGPVSDDCVFVFSLWDEPSDGVEMASSVRIEGVQVQAGLFNVEVDFGSHPFGGDARWLGMEVCCPSPECTPLPLDERQKLTPAPLALALPGLRTEEIDSSPNLIGGHSGNIVEAGVVGATIGGGGADELPTPPAGACSGDADILCQNDEDCVIDNGGCLSEIVGGRCSDGPEIFCMTDEDCEAGTCVPDESVGTCSETFTTWCDEASECPLGEICVPGQIPGTCSDPPDTPCLDDEHCTETCNEPQIPGTCSDDPGIECLTDDDCVIDNGSCDPDSNVGRCSDGPSILCVPDPDPCPVLGAGFCEPFPTINQVMGNRGTIGGGLGNVVGEERPGRQATGPLPIYLGSCSTVGGGCNNTASGDCCTVSGGLSNTAWTEYATIGGGYNNEAKNYATTVAGGSDNFVSHAYGTIAGGSGGRVTGVFGAILGGHGNRVTATDGTVGGGYSNEAKKQGATIGGGYDNTVDANFSAIAGGYNNTVYGHHSAIAGGRANTVSNASYSAIAGGFRNQTGSGAYSAIGGGYSNEARNFGTSVAGGSMNSVDSGHGTIAGGRNGQVTGDYGAILGGDVNQVAGSHGTVGAGEDNKATGDYGTVGGGYSNEAKKYAATIAGGYDNTVDADYSAIAGGNTNNITGNYSAVGGGSNNDVVGGAYSAILGGYYNAVYGDYGALGGGSHNQVDGAYSAIVGGSSSSNAGDYSAVVGGSGNSVDEYADYSMAFGRDVVVTSSYEVALFDDSYPGRLGINRNSTISHPIHVGMGADDGNGAHLTIGGVWTSASSRECKTNFQTLGREGLMSRIRGLPVQAWEYKGTGERHVFPYAEDFQDAFDVGVLKEDGTRERRYLAAMDVAGVALAGVKALDRIVKEKDARIAELEARLTALERAAGLDDRRTQGADSAGPGGATIAAALALLGLTGFMMRAHSRRGGVR
ncbi:MAG: hypothetical protein JSU86_11210 [Phycisphaerales bacterium]|nr:MAG: hypothetical protein JSU86_11210 [Phycisphaerales bacterium]